MRLGGFYEEASTRGMHMKEIGFTQQWLEILDAYVVPIQEKVFAGYEERVGYFL